MAYNPFGGSSSTGSTKSTSTYNPFGSSKKNDGGASFGGFFKNLGRDVKAASSGVFVALGGLVIDPIESAKKIYESYGETSFIGPLVTGDFGEAKSRIYRHPLGNILDMTIVGSIPGKGAALVQRLSKTTPKLEYDTAILAKAPETGISFKVASRNPIKRARQRYTAKIMNDLGELYPTALSKFTYIQKHEKGLRKQASADRRNRSYAEREMGRALQEATELIRDPVQSKKFQQVLFSQFGWDIAQNAGRLKAGQDLPKGMVYVAKEKFQEFRDPKRFNEELPDFFNNRTTKNAYEAMKDKDGYFITYSKDAERWRTEVSAQNKLLDTLWKKPQMLWKWNVLFAPRYLVNTTVGSMLMLAMKSNPLEFIGGFASAIRANKGLKAAEQFVDSGYKTFNRGWMKQHYLPQFEGFVGELGTMEKAGRIGKTITEGKYAGAYYKLANKIEQTIRAKGVSDFIARQPETKALMNKGFTFDEAAAIASKDKAFKARVIKESEDTFGQYYHYEKWEQIPRNIYPFYAWDRAILRHVKNLSSVRAAAIEHVGLAGTEMASKGLEQDELPPGFLQGLIALGGLGEAEAGIPGSPDRFPVLSTAGMNPYATLGEIVSPLIGERPDDLVAGMSPLISYPASAVLTGKTPGGAPIRDVGIPGLPGKLAGSVANIFEELPLSRVVSSGAGLTESTYETSQGEQPFLFSKSWQEMLAGYLGIPIKQISSKAIERRISLSKKLGQL